MASITVRACASFLVTVDAPVHIVSVDHFDGPLRSSREAMADGTVDPILDMDPVGKDDERGELIHSFPRNRLSILHIPDYLHCLRSLADGVSRMAGPAEFDVRNGCDTVPLHVSVAEGAVQFGHFFVMDVVEPDGLLDRNPGKNTKDCIKEAFCVKAESIIGNGSKQGEKNENEQEDDPFFHVNLNPIAANIPAIEPVSV